MDQPNTSDDGAEPNNLVPVAADDDSRAETTYMDADLYTAASKGNISKLEEMLEACDLGLQLTPKRNTTLHIAAQFGQLDCVKRILQLPSSSSLLGQSNLKGDTPLHLAAREGHLTVVQALIQAVKALPDEIESGVGVDKSILRMANEGKDTALHEAVRYHHPEVVKLLIEEDPQFVYGPNISGGTPLYMAVERGHGDLVQIILDHTSTSPAYSGILGRTALHSAVIRNDQEITTKLLEWKPSLTKEVDENGWSPLHCAAHFGYTTIVKQLLHKSPDKSVAYLGIKRGKKTALLIAAERGHKDIVDLLLSYCPDCCEQVDDNGKNVLHFAMMNKQDDYPGMFLQNDGLRVRGLLNEQDAQGDTPLHLLASYLVDDENFVSNDRVDKMGLNNNNLTPKDIVSRIDDWLQKKFVLNHFSKSKEVGIGPLSWVSGDKKDDDSSESKDSKDNSISRLKRTGETHLIVAALVATVTFEAGFTFPGGYNENDGKAILAKKAAFKAFVVTDTLAMVFSKTFHNSTKFVLNHFSKSKEAGIGPLSWVPGDKEDNDSSEREDNEDNSISTWKRVGETHLIVAALVATVTFAAGFTLPGGYNENEGKAILAKKAAFKAFVVMDTLAMVFSVSATFVYFYMAMYDKVVYLQKLFLWGFFLTMFGMGSMMVAFMTGMYAVLPHFSGLPIVVCVLCCCFFLVFYCLDKQLQKSQRV